MSEKLLSLFELLLFGIILIFAIRPVANFDFWFHVKYGEYILKTGSLPFVDVFSHTAYGTPAAPYEWLFQVFIYKIWNSFGSVGVQTAVVTCVLIYMLLFRQLLKEVFGESTLPRMLFLSLAFILGYDFWVERPQIVAYTLFMAVLYLVLKRAIRGKNWLIFSIPLFVIWTNLHASMILGLYLFFAIGIFSLVRFLKTKNPIDLNMSKDLLLFGSINALITLLPPLHTHVYQLLFLFFEKRNFISQVIDEWVPLWELSVRFYVYLAIMAVAGIAFAWSMMRYKKYPHTLLLLPLLPLALFVITGVRQTPFSLPIIFLLIAPAIKLVKIHLSLAPKYALALTLIAFSTVALFFYRQVVLSQNDPYPEKAIPFIKTYLKGNMFNELEMGGYLMYHLGPDMKTFIDGRTDMFLPVVFPELAELSKPRYANNTNLNLYFTQLANKYHVSWVILTQHAQGPLGRLIPILAYDPAWQLVYMDTVAVIYVRRDGVNDDFMRIFSGE